MYRPKIPAVRNPITPIAESPLDKNFLCYKMDNGGRKWGVVGRN